ncbi:MAG: hypothetical protein ACR2GW_09865, partial [Pyrinomonadaceae bacterium]
MSHRRACDLDALERANLIRQTEIGGTLDESLLLKLATAAFALDVRRRRFVYRAGDVADALFLLTRGRVK